MYFYDDNPVRIDRRPTPYHQQKATENYIRHYSNYLMLKFFEQNETDFRARAQATKEIGICERKLHYWKRHPNFDIQAHDRQKAEIDRHWATTPAPSATREA